MVRHGPHAPATVAVAVALIALPAAMAPRHDAATRAAQGPRLAISISDGKVAARAGQALTYTIRLRNTGIVCAAHLDHLPAVQPGPARRARASLLPAAAGLCLLSGCLVAMLLIRRGWRRWRPSSRPGGGKALGRHAAANGHPAEPSEPESSHTLPSES
jgi:hypothetical protein